MSDETSSPWGKRPKRNTNDRPAPRKSSDADSQSRRSDPDSRDRKPYGAKDRAKPEGTRDRTRPEGGRDKARPEGDRRRGDKPSWQGRKGKEEGNDRPRKRSDDNRQRSQDGRPKSDDSRRRRDDGQKAPFAGKRGDFKKPRPEGGKPNFRKDKPKPNWRESADPSDLDLLETDMLAEMPAEDAPERRLGDRHNEYRVYGVNACIAAFQKRPDDIIRGYFSESIAGKFGETMRYLAQHKKAYRVVEDAELEKVSQSQHHGGVCFLMKKKPALGLADLLSALQGREQVCLVILEAIGNPHNLGAILRSCANFDVPAVLVKNASQLQSGAAARVAEGGSEWVDLVEYSDIGELMEQLRAAGFSLLSTSSHKGRDLYRTELPARTVIILGEESRGLTASTLDAAELCVKIPGTERVESLNVSLAAGILLGEYWRQQHSGKRPAVAAKPVKKPVAGRLKLKR